MSTNNKTSFLKPALLISLLIFFAGNLSCFLYQKEVRKEKTITFELPLPEAIEKKYLVHNETLIENVILAGFFSEWDPENTNYLMKQVSSKKWQIRLPFDPGDNQYKFVLHLSNSPYSVVWTHDKAAKKQVDDKNGGLNSVITIVHIDNIWNIFNWIMLPLIILMLGALFYPRIPFSRILNGKLGKPIALVTGILILLASLGFYTVLSIAQLKKHTWDIFYNSLSGIRMMAAQENLSLEHSEWPEVRFSLARIYKKWLWSEMEVARKQYFQNAFPFIGLIFMNKDFAQPDFAYRAEENPAEETMMQNEGYMRMDDMIRNRYFTDLIEKLKTSNVRIQNFRLQSRISSYMTSGWDFDWKLPGFRYRVSMCYPVVENKVIVGWQGMYARLPFLEESGPGFILLLIILGLILGIPEGWFLFFRKSPRTTQNGQALGQLSESRMKEFHITDREKEIIRMIFEGLATKEISGKLFISTKTVDSHIYKIYQKTGVKNRIELYNLLKE